MHMNFWWGTDIGDFFIKGFTINGSLGVTALCFTLFILSILSEGLKVSWKSCVNRQLILINWKISLFFKVHRAKSRAKLAREQRRSVNSENTTLLSNNETGGQPLLANILKGVIDVTIFSLHNILSYGLMLAVMMYNGYIFLAVVLGSFVGHFLFGHISMKTNMENLQAIQTKIVCSTRCADSGESKLIFLNRNSSTFSILSLLRFSYHQNYFFLHIFTLL